MKFKTSTQKNIIRRRCKFPVFWKILSDVPHCMIIKNWITGTIRMIAK